MRRIVHLNSMMSQYGFRYGGGNWHRDYSVLQSLRHVYNDGEGCLCEVIEVFPNGNEHLVLEVKLIINGKRVDIKSYKQMFRYLNERLLEKVMEV